MVLDMTQYLYQKDIKLNKLEHENIIKLHDVIFDKVNNNVYLVLDYFEKGDLSKFLKNRPLKEMYAKK